MVLNLLYICLPQVFRAFLASLVLVDLREKRETKVLQSLVLMVIRETTGYLDLQVHLVLEANLKHVRFFLSDFFD